MVNTRPYCLYRHTSPSGKTYIGITRREPKSRWGVNGSRYLRNQAYPFSRAILKYGWNNIKHEILFNDLTPEQKIAAEKQKEKMAANQSPIGFKLNEEDKK